LFYIFKKITTSALSFFPKKANISAMGYILYFMPMFQQNKAKQI